MDERKEHIYNALYLIAVCHDRQGQPAVPEAFLGGLKRRLDDAVEQGQVSPRLGEPEAGSAGTRGQSL